MANGNPTVVVELRARTDKVLADLRRAEGPIANQLKALERRAMIGVGAGQGIAAGIGAGGGKAAAAKLAGVAAIFAAVDQGLSQFAGAFKDPANRDRSTAAVGWEAAQAASGAVLLETPIVGKIADAIAAALDHAIGAAPGAGYLDALNRDRSFLRGRAESVRALEPGGAAVSDRFGASTPFGQFVGGGNGTEALALLREIAANSKVTAVSNRAMQKDSAGFR